MDSNFVTHPKGIEVQYKNWFLYYASYVILERAVPAIEDGMKPVQRRILHAMYEMDDSRFSKVANIIGQSMQYHPHGDASIGDAIVNMGQKEFFIETQGNWGDVRTGDQAAAPRYIEARLSKIAKQIAFNPKLTDWQMSYDGRKREPIVLPMKFPLLLLHGAEGIAVGLSTRILPHNFVELCNASIQHLKGKKIEIYPDFPTGGLMDVSQYDSSQYGGKVKIRCIIEEIDKSTVIIRDTPFSVTTTQLIESIAKAGEMGKLKIKKIIDNTAERVEIVVEIAPGMTVAQTIDALYSFTKCQVSISMNPCVIENKRPEFLSVNEILARNTERTKQLLQKELEIHIAELEEAWHYTSLEKIFFEEQIYKELEKKQFAWEQVLLNIDRAFNPFKSKLKRPILPEDIHKLVEKPVRRIHKMDIDELNEKIRKIEEGIAADKQSLSEIVQFTIDWFEQLKKQYKTGNDRKTEIQTFFEKKATEIGIKNTKLYANLKEGFIGTGLKKDDFLFDCSDMDDIVVITKAGKMKVVKVAEKIFIDKHILHVSVFQRGKDDLAFNMIYLDGNKGVSYAKRFRIGGVTRDKEYDLTQGSPSSKVLYLSQTEIAETIAVVLSQNSGARNKEFNFHFGELSISARSVKGNQLTKYPIHRITALDKKKQSVATTTEVYYDTLFGRTNTQKNGQLVDVFDTHDLLLIAYNDGVYELVDPKEEKIVEASKVSLLQKFNPQQVLTAIYIDDEKKRYYIKRFMLESTTKNRRFSFLGEDKKNTLVLLTGEKEPVLRLNVGTKKEPTYIKAKTNDWVDVGSMRSVGVALPVDKFGVDMIFC